MLIAIFTVRSIEVLAFAIECSGLIARLQVCYAVVGLYHALFCPMQAGGCFAQLILSTSVEVSYATESSHIIETYLMFERFWVSENMSKIF